MSHIVHKSYMGSLEINSPTWGNFATYCTDVQASGGAEPAFFQHTYGLRESYTVVGLNGIQEKIFRYKPSLPKITCSGVITENGSNGVGAANLVDLARCGSKFTAYVTYVPNLGASTINAHSLIEARISTLTININSGESTTFSCEMIGTGLEPVFNSAGFSGECLQILNWSNCGVEFQGLPMLAPDVGFPLCEGDVQAFSLTVTNPILPIYTSTGAFSDPNNPDPQYIQPKKLRIGTQSVTGSVTAYGIKHFRKLSNLITLGLGSYPQPSRSWQIEVAFASPNEKLSDLVLCTVNFSGFGDNAAGVWRAANGSSCPCSCPEQ